MSDIIVSSFALGIGATVVMDLFALLMKTIFGLQPLDYALVGRWLGYLPHGQIIHRPVMSSPPVAGESALGWGFHYLVGVVFAALFIALAGPSWLDTPRLAPALGFGLATLLVPFLILQPGMGAGLAARCTPNPWVARGKSMLAHLSFGAGLWGTGALWALI